MMDQQNLVATRPVSADPSLPLAKALGQWPPKLPTPKQELGAKTSVEELAQELGLRLGDQNALTIRRIKRGKNYSFVRANGSMSATPAPSAACAMAVPPAYRHVRYSHDRARICRPLAATPPAGCNTATMPIGKGPRAPQGASPGKTGRGIAEDPPQRLDASVGR